MADIFLSYARVDEDRARPIAEALQARGWDVWWDLTSLRTGRRFAKAIAEALEQVDCVVVLWSRTAVDSNWVEAEASWAWNHDKLASVLLDAGLLPPFPYHNMHAQNLSSWSGDTAAPAFRKLVADLTEMVGPPAKKPVPPTEGVSADTAEGPKSTAIAPKDADVSAKVKSPIENTAPAAGSPAAEIAGAPPPPTPARASAGGSDRYGRWAEISIPRKRKLLSLARKGEERVIQRLRWIAPGSFQMGSPPDEPERLDDEGPRHEVQIAEGFWLFETACTQALWEAVMGKNPSAFKGADRPVETVTWNDVQSFIERLNEQIPGLGISLPSEAQWEYACRAGTETPFSFGQNTTPEQVNYDGRHPYHDGEEGEYREGTVPVGSLPANPWGLYEMHGNVWEWVQDAWHDLYEGAPTDGSAWESKEPGADRVIRGGSWSNYARNCRCAGRGGYRPGGRDDDLGFRCARVQE